MHSIFWGFIGTVTLFIIWRIFIHVNSYGIVIGGLRGPYFVFITHSFNIFAQIISSFIFFIVIYDDNNLRYNELTCWANGAALTFFVSFGNFLVSLFSFLKVRFYEIFYQLNPTQRKLFAIVKFFFLCWFLFQIPVRVIIYEVDFSESNYECDFHRSMETNITVGMMYVFFIGAHCITFSLTWQLRNVQNENIPKLRTQIKLNLYVVPLIFLSTIMLQGLAQFWVRFGRTQEFEVLLLVFLCDQICNNMIMYATIYVDDTWTLASIFDLGFIDFLAPNSNDRRIPYEANINTTEKFWVCVPGGHPIQASWEEVEAHDIWSHVIKDASRISQNEKYANRGCIFKWCFELFTKPIDEETLPTVIDLSVHSQKVHLHE